MRNIAKLAWLLKFIQIKLVPERKRSCWGPSRPDRHGSLRSSQWSKHQQLHRPPELFQVVMYCRMQNFDSLWILMVWHLWHLLQPIRLFKTFWQRFWLVYCSVYIGGGGGLWKGDRRSRLVLFCFLLTTEKSKLKASPFVNRSQDGFLSSITSITVCMYININIHTASML